MTLDATRREFLNLFRSAAVAGLLPAELFSGQVVPQPPSTSSITSNLLQNMYSVVDTRVQDLEAASSAINQNLMQQLSKPPTPLYNGPTISAASGPPMPGRSGADAYGDVELEGATREDFPADYTKFDPQTGLFGDEGEAALPVGF